MNPSTLRATLLLPMLAAAWLVGDILETWWMRSTYPFDLEWMEGGVLAHAWRLAHGKQIYVDPGPDFIPMIYPPGYPAIVGGLGSIFGISHGLGRFVSAIGTLSACSAIIWVMQRRWRAGWAGVLGAAIFLGTYPRSGAFMDMVRPDATFVGLTAWATALSFEKEAKHHRAAGIMLCLAFIVKHNAASFGFPLALGIWARHSWREALRFGLWAAVPALVFVGWAQWWSSGHFLTWILTVPQSHPMAEPRVFPGSIREMGNTMGVSLGMLSIWLLSVGSRFATRVPVPALVIAPAVGAMFSMWWISNLPKVEGIMPPHRYEALAAYAFLGAGAVLVPLVSISQILSARGGKVWLGFISFVSFVFFISGIVFEAPLRLTLGVPVALMFAAGAVLAERTPQNGAWSLGVAMAMTGWMTSALMRGHHGGFINVFMFLHWVTALGIAVMLADVAKQMPRNLGYPLAAAIALAQLGDQINYFKEANYEPTQADYDAGNELVDALKRVEGPVLSPFAPWTPALAGHEPSWHLIALWDIRHKKGPYVDNVRMLSRASTDRYWGAILEAGDAGGVGIGIRNNYRRLKTFQFTGRALMPRTGWRRRPNVLWVRDLGGGEQAEAFEDTP